MRQTFQLRTFLRSGGLQVFQKQTRSKQAEVKRRRLLWVRAEEEMQMCCIETRTAPCKEPVNRAKSTSRLKDLLSGEAAVKEFQLSGKSDISS